MGSKTLMNYQERYLNTSNVMVHHKWSGGTKDNLNTSNVMVHLVKHLNCCILSGNLNTSNVMVHLKLLLFCFIVYSNLNTSNVMVHPTT